MLLIFIFNFSNKSHAVSGYLNSFNTTYGTKGTAIDSCNLCHTVKPALNNYGNAYLNSGYNFQNIENQDSDGDGFTNITEINARTFPGDPDSKPVNSSDTTPPTAPTNLTANNVTNSSIFLSWSAATDNVGVSGYKIFRDYIEIANTSSTNYTDTNITPSTTYTYYVQAFDAVGNVSPNSNIIQVTTPAVTSNFRILSPNEGEKFQAGSVLPITWEPHPKATYYNISYSTNNGLTWIPIENGIMSNSYNFDTSLFKKNVKCRILVSAFNSNYVQIASDKTDLPITIELATINTPAGGEVLTNGNTLNINWTSSPVLTNTAKVSVYYKLNNSFVWKLAGTLNGNPGNYNWTLPTVNQNSKAIIKIVFRNNMGTLLGTAVSNPITITISK